MAQIRMDSRMRALALKKAIEKACITYGLNLTIYDGRIGFVAQEEMKIVALWDAQYTMEDLEKGGEGDG